LKATEANSTQLLKQILLGGTLADKLAGHDLVLKEIEWETQPVSIALPEKPHRLGKLNPSELARKSEDPNARERHAFPKKLELKNESARGKLLHFFANHELLAIETMAYTLLKFPEAPLEFKMGVLKTIQDEQRHLGLYITRMQECGVGLGDFPLNFYFWKTLQSMQSPLDFVTRMSLTFEQANLDFALEYAKLFEEEIADEKTAQLLQKVHDDEVKHVAHGLKWFNEWRGGHSSANAEISEWEAYSRLLPFPINPRRAKGSWFFSAESRRAAGFSEHYIENLRIAGGSRGKIPSYFYFNPQCEVETQFSDLPVTLKNKIADLRPLLLWLAGAEDVVEMPGHSNLPLDWLKVVHAYHGDLAERIDSVAEAKKYAAFAELKPWGWGRSAWQKHAILSAQIKNQPGGDEKTVETEWFSKVWWKEKLQTPGKVFRDENSFADWATTVVTDGRDDISSGISANDAGGATFLLKSSVSTSGRGHLRFTRDQLRDEALMQKIKKRIREEKEIVIEPFLSKKIDFSTQLEILPDGKVKRFEPRFFQVDDQFQYQGAFVGSWSNHAELGRYWQAIEKNRVILLQKQDQVVQLLREKNYHGPVGIDSLVYENQNSELQVEPVIEVNVRYTMGRVAQEIERALRTSGKKNAQADGVWVFFNKNSLLEHTVRSFAEFEARLEADFTGKFIATTPSATAISTWTALLLGEESHRFLTGS
jgi:uncharacterized ferritin-like protein (DUF455 family)